LNFVPYESFERSAERLRKKFHHFDDDLEGCKKELSQNIAAFATPIPGYEKKVWKTRLKNTDQQKGKSGGYRLIFYYDEQNPGSLYALDVYPKNEREDIPASQLMELYKKFLQFISEKRQQKQNPATESE